MHEYCRKRGSPSKRSTLRRRKPAPKDQIITGEFNKSDLNSPPKYKKITIKIWVITTAEEEKAAEVVNDEVVVVDVLPRDGTEVRL